MTPAQPATVYSEFEPAGIWSGNAPHVILNPFDLNSADRYLPDDTELPYEDGIPLESNWHRLQMNLLIELIEYHWRDRHDFFAGGNMFIYFDRYQALNRNYRGPDFFVVKNTSYNQGRKSWITWKEEGKLPHVIVELASPSTIRIDLTEKKELYEKVFRTPEYFCYDPETLRFYGWRLYQESYTPIPADSRGRMISQEMGLQIGPWQGEHFRHQHTWLRLYTPDGQLVPRFSEAEAQRAEREAEKAKVEAQRAADADRRAEREAEKAKAEAQRAAAAQRRAKAEAQRAADADRRAEREAERAKAEAQRAADADRRAEAEAQRAGFAEAELNRLKALLAEKGILTPG